MSTAVYLEVGSKRVFASAADWPGWCRSGRTPESALATLADYATRYAEVASLAGVRFPGKAGGELTVVGQAPGTASTDFGVPGELMAGDADPLSAAQAGRAAKLLRAAWAYFDTVVAGSPAALRKGPRGGGRDRDKMVAHVLDAEASYGRKLGIKLRPPAIDDEAGIRAQREAIAAVLGSASDGSLLVERGWPARYALRRVTWHVLDHAWEMQDRGT